MKNLFKPAENTQAFLKCGIMGFAGSGKTFTATNIATGLVHYMNEHDLEIGKKPVFFLDTETGSDWVKPRFEKEGIELFTAKTRAFVDLVPAVKECEKNGSVLIIDSISHFWKELMESYARKKNRKYGLQFQDWAWLKEQWGKFTDEFVNSNCHIIMCGRAGYEYDFFENEGGKKELEKTGIKMKAETETGYEPSILMLMERHTDLDTKKTYRTATILKDRSDLLDGKEIKNPKFDDILPHIQFLNTGGKQLGIDTKRNSESIISSNEKAEGQIRKEQVEIELEELQGLIQKYFPSQSKEDKESRMNLFEKYFNTRSWTKITTMKLEDLKKIRKQIENDLLQTKTMENGAE